MKIIKRILLVLLLVAIDFSVVTDVANAMSASNVELYKKGEIPLLVRMDNELDMKEKYVYAKLSVTDSPAYCLNQFLEGVTEENPYSVTVENNEMVSDEIWKIIINGFPYKTAAELGCSNNEEAFAATQEVVYSKLENYDLSRYEGVGEAGNRVISAMKQISDNAQNSNETLTTNEIKLEGSENWETDKVNSEYVSKTYTVTPLSTTDKYTVSLGENESLPEGLKIVDLNNQEKSEFVPEEQFKVLIPTNLEQETIDFKLDVTAPLKSNHVYYGKAPNSNLQNYAVTKQYELVTNSLKEQYNKENSKGKEVTKASTQSSKLPQTGF